MAADPPVKIDVILADDHAAVREGIRRFLESAGDVRVVAEVADGLAAIEAIRALKPALAVLDIKMPGASGIEVTRWIRASAPSTGVLILTAYDEEPFVRAALEAGANGFLLKDADCADIVRAVREVNEGRSVLDPDIASKVMALIARKVDGDPVERLTERELQVLRLAAKGQTNKSIGFRLGISDRTVQGHLARICDKLNAGSRTEAVMRAVSLGWLAADVGRMPET
jgi:DNA-binding NarL/FixJ family response regulator